MSHLFDTDHTTETNPATAPDPDPESPPESDQEWSVHLAPHRPGSRRIQLTLAALVIMAAGFIGRFVTTQQVNDSQQPSGLPAGFQLTEGMQIPGAGTGGVPDVSQLAALSGGSPTYTVTVVDGSTLYLRDAAGKTVKVTTLPSTKVRGLSRSSTAKLRPGDTVTVDGAADDNGTIQADHVDQTG